MREEHLVALARQGQVAAFEELVQRHQQKVYNLAYRMMGNREDAYDMAQEALTRAFAGIGRFRGRASFSTWLYRITTNTCLDELRRRKRQPVYSIDETLATEDGELRRQLPDDSAPAPDEVVTQRELERELQGALQKLSEEHRTVVLLRDYLGLAYEEISEALSVELGTVKSRLFRARRSLKALLEEAELFPHGGVNVPRRGEEA